MNKQALHGCIDGASAETLRSALRILLKPHTVPVFAAVKVIEHEVAALKALRQLGFLPANFDEYALVETLRVTKQKARSLLYQAALRGTQSEAEYENELRVVLSSPRIQRESKSSLFLIEVPQPLTMDRL